MSNKYNYQITPIAEQDIDSALAYISENLSNPKAAADLFLEIERAINEICTVPYGFPDCEIYLISDENIRHVPIDNYILVYEISGEENKINILRFRYAKMKLANLPVK